MNKERIKKAELLILIIESALAVVGITALTGVEGLIGIVAGGLFIWAIIEYNRAHESKEVAKDE